MSKTVVAHTDEQLAAELEQLAHATGRNQSTVVANALRSHVASERDFVVKVEAGLADVKCGRLTDHETVAEAIRQVCRSIA